MTIKSLLYTKEYLYFKDVASENLPDKISQADREMQDSLIRIIHQKISMLEVNYSENTRYEDSCFRTKNVKFKDKETGEKKKKTTTIQKKGFKKELQEINLKQDKIEYQINQLEDIAKKLENRDEISNEDAESIKSLLNEYKYKPKFYIIFSVVCVSLIALILLLSHR